MRSLPVMFVLAALAALGCAYAAPQMAGSEGAPTGVEIERPADVDTWPTVGVTMRMDRTDMTLPNQLRQVQMAPVDYAHFVETGALADGARFAVAFYPVRRDDTHTPPLYHGAPELAFAMEVIDRAHPDGRRFYTFAQGVMRAAALPAGNACAVCHNERGSFDGTFAHMYPLMARRLAAPR